MSMGPKYARFLAAVVLVLLGVGQPGQASEDEDSCPPGTTPVINPDRGFVGCAEYPEPPPLPDEPDPPTAPPDRPGPSPIPPKPNCPSGFPPALIGGAWYCPPPEEEEEEEEEEDEWDCGPLLENLDRKHTACVASADRKWGECMGRVTGPGDIFWELIFQTCNRQQDADLRKCDQDKERERALFPPSCGA